MEKESEKQDKKTGWLSLFALHFDKSQWLVFITMSVMAFFAATCISLQGPFFPQEAEKRGVSAKEYGLVFGIFELVGFISSPIYGKYIDKVGAKFLAVFGIMLGGFCSILFGLLDMIETHDAFLSLALILRTFEALGSSAANTASLTIVSAIFPHDRATAFGTIETSYGLGLMFGPVIGGYFYQIGGYFTPFAVVGCLLVLDGLLNACVLPSEGGENKTTSSPAPSIVSVLRLPTLTLDLASVLSLAFSVGFIFTTLEPHIRQFELSLVEVGALFAIVPVTSIVLTPLVGRLTDTRIRAKKLVVFGALCVVASFSFTGPLPFIPVKPALWMVYVGLVLQGVAMACMWVPASTNAIHSAIRGGLPDNMATYGVVNGLNASSYALGVFMGASMAGLLLDTVGFRQGSLLVVLVHALLAVAVAWSDYTVTEHSAHQYSPLQESKEVEPTHTALLEYGTTAE